MCDTLTKLLQERNLPALGNRDEMLSLLLEQQYGFLPPKPETLTFEEVEKHELRKFFPWKACARRIVAKGTVNGKAFSFPFNAVIPVGEGKHPFFVHINFRDCVPDRYEPTEELVDHGFAVLSFCYKAVTDDNGDFTDGLAGVLSENGQRGKSDAGKIAIWAWAAQRVMDYACTRADVLDLDRSIVCGHSRLGKTALLTAATDTRFQFAYSNDSGCCGAALSRGKTGETVENITTKFPYWFCENYLQYAGREDALPFDQHYLLASIAPRYVCVGSATGDLWAGPDSEFLSCLAASPAFEKGFCCPDRMPETGDAFLLGNIGYHRRAGLHAFSREDWNRLIQFVLLHK